MGNEKQGIGNGRKSINTLISHLMILVLLGFTLILVFVSVQRFGLVRIGLGSYEMRRREGKGREGKGREGKGREGEGEKWTGLWPGIIR